MGRREGRHEPVALEHFERVRGIVDGVVPSRSDARRKHIVAILLQAVFTCTCDSFLLSPQREPCDHMKRLLEEMDAEELRRFVIEAHHIPEGNEP